ncbi:MAG: PHP domain-containing protein [Clostridia bacterium]
MAMYADTHIHSALSPCAEEEMTPNNIVRMAVLNGLHLIALTDHNSVMNCIPTATCAKKAGLKFIPGMELETSEEIHVICLFKDIESALEMQENVWKRLPSPSNRTDIFGRQLVFDESDCIVDEVERLLSAPADIGIYQAADMLTAIGGIMYPAHIQRNSYSILTNLGAIPEDLPVQYLEITDMGGYNQCKGLGYPIIYSSDAHRLEGILSRERCKLPFPEAILTYPGCKE